MDVEQYSLEVSDKSFLYDFLVQRQQTNLPPVFPLTPLESMGLPAVWADRNKYIFRTCHDETTEMSDPFNSGQKEGGGNCSLEK